MAWWFSLWFCLNMSVTLVNKIFYTTLAAPYPWAMTTVHLTTSAILSSILLSGALTTRYGDGHLLWRTHKKLIGLSLLFVLNIVVGNASLVHASVPFVQMLRCTVPAMTAALSFGLLGQRQSHRQLFALTGVVVGALVLVQGSWGDLTPLGVMVTLVGCLLCSCKAVLTSMILDDPTISSKLGHKISPLEVLRTLATCGALEAWPIVLYREPQWLGHFIRHAPAGVVLLLLLHGVQAFALNVANFEATKATSATVMTIGGNMKAVMTSGMSMVLLGEKVSPVGLVGMFMCAGGMWWYNLERLREKSAAHELLMKSAMAEFQQAPDLEEHQVSHSSHELNDQQSHDDFANHKHQAYGIPLAVGICGVIVGACCLLGILKQLLAQEPT
eukprot:TRINITY_DN2626_c0_g2_i1.p1 TRINITY_DN2626_c0_g2~~TRINITY_DN2626_c0_g2_i1.p1  ORF type:complete len:386 (-),score=71.32 TRINITY_DN2626_c0_g2_i1:110-1267(-)